MAHEAHLRSDGGLHLSQAQAQELRRCLVRIEAALKSFDGAQVSPADSTTGAFERADNRRDLKLVRTLLEITGRPDGDASALDLYANEARPFAAARHDLYVACAVYDRAKLKDGRVLDLRAATEASLQLARILGDWGVPRRIR
jgi:hypothetical protein